jgi:hypothetical protein
MTQTQVIEKCRIVSPATTPQALAWDARNKTLWMGSRDLHRIYAIDPNNGKALKQQESPGIPWAAVAVNGELRFTIGEGRDDDRYIYRYTPETGFSKMFACPEFTGSYLSFDVLRGQENPNEDWRIARLSPQEETPAVKDIGIVPFASRSLTFDGKLFWSNYRAKDTIISFALPN